MKPRQRVKFEELNNDLRVTMFITLMLYPELNVTQVANLLGKSKATVSRHLNAMEEAGFFTSQDDETAPSGRITPRVYRLDRGSIERYNPFSAMQKVQLDDPIAIIAEYRAILDSVKAFIYLFQRALALLEPLVEKLERSLDVDLTHQADKQEISRVQDEFQSLLLGGSVDFQTLLFSPERMEEFKQLYTKFRADVNRMARIPEEGSDTAVNTMLFMDVLMPMMELLDLQIKRVSGNGQP